MFNATIVNNPTRFIATEHHEHRAPTDESVRLLKELEGAALEKILSVNRLKDNALDAAWSIWNDPQNLELTAICRLKLNGRELKLTIPIDRSYRKEDNSKVIEGIVKRISEELTLQFFTQCRAETMLLR